MKTDVNGGNDHHLFEINAYLIIAVAYYLINNS